MKIWIDDIRPAPEGYIWIKSVNEASELLNIEFDFSIMTGKPLEIFIDIDHDAGSYYSQGGDYIEILNMIENVNHYAEEHDLEKQYKICPTIHIHSMNPVGVENMRAIIRRNKWKEI